MEEIQSSSNDKPSSPAATATSLRIAAHVASTEGKDTNLVFSPLLLQVVLSLIAAGSNGSTRQQLLSFLESESVEELNRFASEVISVALADGSAHGGPKLCFVNGVWVDGSVCLKETFNHIVDHIYKATYQRVDFQTKATEVTNEVNSWIERNTNGLIKELIPFGSVDSDTRLILANALYFKGAWTHSFDSSRTSNSNFYLLNGGSVTVPFMTSKGKQFIKSYYSGFKVLRLCYEQGSDDNRQLSMYIFLPDTINGLPSLLKKVSSEPDFLDQHVPHFQVEVGKFMVPRFKFSFGFETSETLKQLGLTLPFSNPDLSEMVDSEVIGKNLCVSKIFHKAFIEVNEEGTEAAAATAAIVMLRCARIDNDKVDFVADHPFMFLIREDISGVVLFIGHVMNPKT